MWKKERRVANQRLWGDLYISSDIEYVAKPRNPKSIPTNMKQWCATHIYISMYTVYVHFTSKWHRFYIRLRRPGSDSRRFLRNNMRRDGPWAFESLGKTSLQLLSLESDHTSPEGRLPTWGAKELRNQQKHGLNGKEWQRQCRNPLFSKHLPLKQC